jgi:hypothetical protein
MLALPKIRFLAEPSRRTQSVCWVLALIGILGLMAGGIRLLIYFWDVAAQTDAEAMPCGGRADCPLTLTEMRHSTFLWSVGGTAIVCLGIGLFHTWARNAECGWLSRRIRSFVAGYVEAAAAIGLFLCGVACVEWLFLMVRNLWWFGAPNNPVNAAIMLALILGSGAVAILGYLYWYRPKWGKK